MRKLFFIFIFFLLGNFVFSQLEIEKKNRIANSNPGYCAWCSIEMLGRQHKIKSLEGLVDKRKKNLAYQGTDSNIRSQLNELKIRFKMSNTGEFDKKLLEWAIKNELGCAVGFRVGAFGNEAHIVVLTKYDKNKVEIVDPNDIRTPYEASREWFDKWWDGFLVVIERVDYD